MPIKKQPCEWQNLLKNSINTINELLASLALNPEQLPISVDMQHQFPLRVTRSFVARMEKGNPADPLLLQALPVKAEEQTSQGYTTDPLEEKKYNPLPGLIHKYHGRVLFTLTGACAIHCRYCFRRHFPYAHNNPAQQGWEEVLSYIRSDTSITEVILSGGDPLMQKDDKLLALFQKIATITHIKTLRIHTRLPIVLPERISEDLLNVLNGLNLQIVVVIHCNHPNEIDETVSSAIKKLKKNNITVFNQSVLLKNVNDTVDTLVLLSEKLFSVGVLPYYLHLLDKVQGAAHFEVPEEKAKRLYEEMTHRLPGYLVPKLVKEVPGKKAKQQI